MMSPRICKWRVTPQWGHLYRSKAILTTRRGGAAGGTGQSSNMKVPATADQCAMQPALEMHVSRPAPRLNHAQLLVFGMNTTATAQANDSGGSARHHGSTVENHLLLLPRHVGPRPKPRMLPHGIQRQTQVAVAHTPRTTETHAHVGHPGPLERLDPLLIGAEAWSWQPRGGGEGDERNGSGRCRALRGRRWHDGRLGGRRGDLGSRRRGLGGGRSGRGRRLGVREGWLRDEGREHPGRCRCRRRRHNRRLRDELRVFRRGNRK